MIRPSNHTHRGNWRCGFTSVESVVVIFILSGLRGIPSARYTRARLAGNKALFVADAFQYCYDAPELDGREYPDNLHEWGNRARIFQQRRMDRAAGWERGRRG